MHPRAPCACAVVVLLHGIEACTGVVRDGAYSMGKLRTKLQTVLSSLQVMEQCSIAQQDPVIRRSWTAHVKLVPGKRHAGTGCWPGFMEPLTQGLAEGGQLRQQLLQHLPENAPSARVDKATGAVPAALCQVQHCPWVLRTRPQLQMPLVQLSCVCCQPN